MNVVTFSKTYAQPPFCEEDILRYAGCKEANSEMAELLRACLDESREKLTYKVCYRELPLKIDGDCCDFGIFQFRSKALARNLEGCKQSVLFAATVGVGLDRLIAKYSRLSPSKALMFQAIGAERIEALCDMFCADISEEYRLNIKPRFSPGYGDLPLESQKTVFAVLDCSKQLGVTLTDSLLMSPSKSVTAIVGLCSD